MANILSRKNNEYVFHNFSMYRSDYEKLIIIAEKNDEIYKLQKIIKEFIGDNNLIPSGTQAVNFSINVVINPKYVSYINQYGFPINGIFDQTLLDSL